jgi:hypothetical protein
MTDLLDAGQISPPPPPLKRGKLAKDEVHWESMDGFPDDGKPVLLKGPEGQVVEAVWRHTRRWTPVNGRWLVHSFWALRDTGGTPVDFEPVGWRAGEPWP